MNNNQNEKFFKSSVTPELHRKILAAAEVELKLNRQAAFGKKFLVWVLPLFTAATASFFIFKIQFNTQLDTNQLNTTPIMSAVGEAAESIAKMAGLQETFEMALDSVDDEDMIEITSELSLLEDLDALENISEADLEG